MIQLWTMLGNIKDELAIVKILAEHMQRLAMTDVHYSRRLTLGIRMRTLMQTHT